MSRKSERGTVLPFVAASLAVLMGFGGISVDVGYLEYRQQAQQNATDAAALGGANALVRASCPNQTAAQNAATLNATNNGFASSGNVTITVSNPPAGGPFASNNCAVTVAIQTTQVATFLSRVFGYPHGMTETTAATAIVSPTGAGCIYLLSPSNESNFNGANITAKQCGLLINDTANFNGATIGVQSIGYAGVTPNENGANFTMATPAPMLPVADPCQEITGCAYLAANPPPMGNCTSQNYNGYTGPVPSGCYSYLNLNGANVTMNGTYVFTGTQNFNGATVRGSNVTMYVSSTGSPPNFNGANVTMSPPTPGPGTNTPGVLYYQVPSNTTPPNFNGATNSYSGLIYAPGALQVNVNGASGGYVVLVFGSANFNGSSAIDFATPPPNQSLVNQAVVAQ
jgi:Putative Flp pilus-assembly TadE/G-like